MVYGQALDENQIIMSCVKYLEKNSVGFNVTDIKEKKLNGQSPKGWMVLIQCKKTGALGASTEQTFHFEVQYSPMEKDFFAIELH